ncbi:dentin sialophosphoprotein [Engraulis encrasicolus]|uniref:dentin sialophosphoprotein n=1 Tax=Engraulis encrasicolus TaxID=184585 RepID=UPI002FD5B86F
MDAAVAAAFGRVSVSSRVDDAFRSASGSRDSLQFSGATARSESEDSGVDVVGSSGPGSPWSSHPHQHAMVTGMGMDMGIGMGSHDTTHDDPSRSRGSEVTDDRGEATVHTAADDHHHHHHHPLPVSSSSPTLSTRSYSTSSSSSLCQSVGSELRCPPPLSLGEGTSTTATTAPHPTLERALQRADPARRQIPRRGLSLVSRGDDNKPSSLQRRRSAASHSSHASHTSHGEGTREHRGQRSLSFKQGGGATQTQSAAVERQDSAATDTGLQTTDSTDSTDTDSRLQSQQTHTETTSESTISRLQAQASGVSQDGWAELSPGFLYLEQVCLMLERFAKLQAHQRGLQTEMEQLRNQQNHRPQYSTQHSVAEHCVRVQVTSCDGDQTDYAETMATQALHGNALGLDILSEVRRRSSSDAGRLTTSYHNRRRSKSIGDLLEEDEEDTALSPDTCGGHELAGERQGRGARIKQKIASLRRNEPRPDMQAMRSQTLPRKKSSLRSLGQFFMKRSKTTST